MASSIQILRSSIAKERPFPGNLLDGQPAINTNQEEPGLFFKASDGTIVKFGPAAITSDGNPPNTGGVGQLGNTIGELWLDKFPIVPVLRVYDGSQWIDAGSGGGGGGGAGSFVRWIYTAIGGETSLSGVSAGVPLQYQPGLEEVFINGALITRGTDYNAISGSNIIDLQPLTTGDVVTVTSVIPLSIVQLPGQVTLLRWSTLATAGQTVLSGSDSTSQQLVYTAGLEEVYVNGAFLRRGVDYTATNGSTITILAPLTLNDEITVLAWAPFVVAPQPPGQVTLLRWSTLATAGQTALSGVDSSSQQLAYTAGLEEVYVNGAFLRRGVDYTAANGSTITVSTPLKLNDEITVLAWTPFVVGSQIVNADVDPNAGITSNKLSFTQSGIGAVSRSVDSKLKETVSVKDFGAVGDGVADDTAAIQAAITASNYVFIPVGTYLISSSISLHSGSFICGEGTSSVIKANANGITCLSATNTSGVSVENIYIDGGGQTTSVAAGIANANGMWFYGSNNIRINKVTITKCGVSSPTLDDSFFGGFGIGISPSSTQDSFDIVIDSCNITRIAGRGGNRGDGISINGTYGVGQVKNTYNVSVAKCFIQYCGRHCISVAGAVQIPYGVRVIGSNFNNSALCGIDVESATDSVFESNHFKYCGNDQFYFNPAVDYGPTFLLLAGVSVTSSQSQRIIFSHNILNYCYYGIHLGAGSNFTISENTCNNSIVNDLYFDEAQSPQYLVLSNNQFLTYLTIPFVLFYRASIAYLKCYGNYFSIKVKLGGVDTGEIKNNTFVQGLEILYVGTRKLEIKGNTFLDYGSTALNFPTTGAQGVSITISENKFVGGTYGISIEDDALNNDVNVTNNQFIACSVSGILIANGKTRIAIDNNYFNACVSGIIYTVGSCSQSSYSNNKFNAITSYCMLFNDGGGLAFNRNQIIGNIASNACANGIRLLGAGPQDYNIIMLNNLSGVVANRLSFPAGNANGYTTNNVLV